MATAKPFKTNLVPIGKIAPTAGSPLSLVNNYTDLGAEPFSGIYIQALVGNTGNCYVLNSNVAADKTNYTNVLQVLAAGNIFSAASIAVNTLSPFQIFIDVDNTGAGVVGWLGQL